MSRFPPQRNIPQAKQAEAQHDCNVTEYLTDIPDGTYSIVELWEKFTEWLKEQPEIDIEEELAECKIEHMLDELENVGASLIRVRGLDEELVMVDSDE